MAHRNRHWGRAIWVIAPIIGCQTPPLRSCGSERVRAVDTPDQQASRGWPNEPAGFRVLSDEPFNALTENGWRAVQRRTTNGSGVFLATDSTAPHSPLRVLAFRFAAGFPGGYEPGVSAYMPPTPIKETYFGLWWKPSDPWQNHAGSNVNKIAFLFPSAGHGPITLVMFHTGSGYSLQVVPEFSGDTRRLAPNATATPVTLGTWHLIEWYVKYSSTATSRDGVTRWWLDGVLQGAYPDLQMPEDAGFIEYQLAPTWGGMLGMKTETDFYCYDHAHISRP